MELLVRYRLVVLHVVLTNAWVLLANDEHVINALVDLGAIGGHFVLGVIVGGVIELSIVVLVSKSEKTCGNKIYMLFIINPFLLF